MKWKERIIRLNYRNSKQTKTDKSREKKRQRGKTKAIKKSK